MHDHSGELSTIRPYTRQMESKLHKLEITKSYEQLTNSDDSISNKLQRPQVLSSHEGNSVHRYRVLY